MGKKCRILRHSWRMVGKTLRSYGLLSVTIVLSFSLLLGYLLFVDSEIYNEYKMVFGTQRGYLKIWDMNMPRQFDALLEKVSQMEDTCFYTVHSTQTNIHTGRFQDQNGTWIATPQVSVDFLSGYVWEYFNHLSTPYELTWLDGKDHAYVDLKPGEGILDTISFRALGLDQMEEPFYTFRLTGTEGEVLEMPVRIVGVLDRKADTPVVWEGGADSLSVHLLLPLSCLSQEEYDMFSMGRYGVFYSQTPQNIYQLAKRLGIEPGLLDSIYILQDQVRGTIQARNSTKALVTGAMLLILGINLYSSFGNALNERKFEIGVKRALGASRFHIVRQFLYEGLTVMGVNILISLSVVLDLGLIYRLIVENTRGKKDFLYETYTLYLSPYSAAMFFICAITLTVVFSLIFAYRSTQVQVIDYLKAE